MKYFTNLLLFLFLSTSIFGQKQLETLFETSNGKETPDYDATLAYCKKLADFSPMVKFTYFGNTALGYQLPLLIVDKDKDFAPHFPRKKAVVMIQACIHPGEPDGKDAGFLLIRDIVTKKEYEKLLDHVTILFLPVVNVEGHLRFGPYNRINQEGPEKMGWRTNSLNLNLNRDHLKADAVEMRHWLKFFDTWLPEFFIDCHTTDGADYQYTMTYSVEKNTNLDADITTFVNKKYIPEMETKMEQSGYLMFPYVVFRKWHDPRSGLYGGSTNPMLSQAYAAIKNRASILLETHQLKDYKTRVLSTYKMLEHTLTFVNSNYQTLIDLCTNADKKLKESSLVNSFFPISYQLSFDSIMVKFKGVEYDVIKSDISKGEWFKYYPEKPVEFEIPFQKTYKPSVYAKIPYAYIVPAQYLNIKEILDAHGITYFTTKMDANIEVSSYLFKNINFRQNSFEGRQGVTADYDSISEVRNFPRKSIIVPLNQRNALVIIHLFEPKAPSSLFGWGFFNTCMESKEYFESYAMELLVREMLEKDSVLKVQYEEKMQNDKTFSSNPRGILQWFYEKTPYYDNQLNKYPIGKIFSQKELSKLLK